MNKTHLLILLLLTITNLSYSLTNCPGIQIGERKTITSSVLNEERDIQIYLPPSYFSDEKATFPILYLMDGDYNFLYTTGLVELLSTVSEKIPETIVVGISDKGKIKYRQNCTPAYIPGKNGSAADFMKFIEEELKPFVRQSYRSSDYETLVGHSMGGLFVTHYLLEKPEAFDNFIAIEPSLWMGNYEIVNRADSILSDRENLRANFFISLADTKEMGIRQLVGILDKHFPYGDKWDFMYFENENHNSVGLPTMKESLESIFANWEISREQFYSFKSAQEIIAHYHALAEQFSSSIAIPSQFLGNVIYYYFIHEKKEDLAILEQQIKLKFPASVDDFYHQLALNYLESEQIQKAIDIYKKSIVEDPDSYLSYSGLSKVYLQNKSLQKAFEMSEKAIEIAGRSEARQWILNELRADNDVIRSEMKK